MPLHEFSMSSSSKPRELAMPAGWSRGCWSSTPPLALTSLTPTPAAHPGLRRPLAHLDSYREPRGHACVPKTSVFENDAQTGLKWRVFLRCFAS
jgi:hypothetical protein